MINTSKDGWKKIGPWAKKRCPEYPWGGYYLKVTDGIQVATACWSGKDNIPGSQPESRRWVELRKDGSFDYLKFEPTHAMPPVKERKRSKNIRLGNEYCGVSVHYSNSKKQIDVHAFHEGGVELDGGSISLREFLYRLGITKEHCFEAFEEIEAVYG